MERQEFLSKLGLGMAIVCTGCSLVSCGGSKSANPGPTNTGGGNPPPPGSGNVATIDLTSKLAAIGDSFVSNGVIVVRLAAGNTASSFTAVQVACTHQGTAINYNAGQGKFICPNHGSQFSTSGAVLLGPAASSLQKYNIVIDGNNLVVSA